MKANAPAYALRFGALLLASGLAAALAGCGASADPDPHPDLRGSQETEPAASEVSGGLTVYAAASLEPAFEEVGGWFVEEHPGVSLEFSYDGSSMLATQILSGAPADVFASADAPNMEKITAEGLGDGEPIGFATSELAIAVAPGNPLGIESLADLAGSGGDAPVTVLCAAEVPCGNAAHALLERDGVELDPASEEQNVTAVLTKVREREADAGLVYRSDVLRAQGEVEGVEIEHASDAAGDYLVVPMAGSDAPDTATAFAEFLRSERPQRLLADLGFGPAR